MFGKKTTNTRVLLDASWKQPRKSSLNDLLYAGPCLFPKLYEIILFFRCRKIALAAVIKQAFL